MTLTAFRERVINNVGLSRRNRYIVLIGNIDGINTKFRDDILLFCEGAQLPSKSFASNPHRMFGETRQVPYEKLFNELNLSFYVDNDYKVKDFFEAWMGTVQNRGNRKFNYYDSYTTTVEMIILDVADNPKYRVRFNEVYIKEVGDMDYNYGHRDIQKLPIKLVFRNENYGGPQNIRENYGDAPVITDALSSYTGEFDSFQQNGDNPFRFLFDSAVVQGIRSLKPVRTDLGTIKLRR